jgi:hypothetical protein
LHEKARHIFRTPLWRKVLPVFLASLAWIAPLAMHYLASLAGSDRVSMAARTALAWLHQSGVTQERATQAAIGWSVLMLVWLYREFASLVVTPTAIVRRLPPFPARVLRWEDADEILIEHATRLWEGRRSARKVLTVYERPRWYRPWRRPMRVSNRQIEGYHRVENLAVAVSVPAIARRKVEQLASRGKPVVFTQFELGDGFWVVFWAAAAVLASAAFALDKLWRPPYDMVRPATVWIAGIAALLAARRLLVRQVAVGRDIVHILFAGMPYKAIPVESIVSMKATDNRLKFFVRKAKGDKARCVFSTRRFIRNRGVMLRMIRELQNQRTLEDRTPIVPVRAVRARTKAGPQPAVPEQAPGPETEPKAPSPAAITLNDLKAPPANGRDTGGTTAQEPQTEAPPAPSQPERG